MHFAYVGFTHEGNRRSFMFRGIEQGQPESIFSIEVDFALLLRNQVRVQEGPMFCLQLLTTASASGLNCLDGLHCYRVVGDDFRSLLMERERSAAEKALKKRWQKPVKKPSLASNLHLGNLSRGH